MAPLVQAGLRPEQLDVPFESMVDSDALLARSAVPVLDELIGDLAGAIVGVVLTDECGHVIDRPVAHRGLRGLALTRAVMDTSDTR